MNSWNWELFWQQGIFVRKYRECWLLGAGRKEVTRETEVTFPFFYFPDFFLSSYSIWKPLQLQEFTTEELQSHLQQMKNSIREYPHKKRDWSWELPEFSAFSACWHDLQLLFKTQRLQKIVPVVFEIAKAIPNLAQRVDMLSSCLQRDEKYYPYGFWLGTEGLLGLSSEVLFEQSQGIIKSMALAGTRSRQEDGNLLQVSKEMKEHQYVIDGLRENLQHWGTVQQEETREWSVGELVHLKTDLFVKTERPIPFFELVKELHPTPALGGTPRPLALGLA